MAAADQLLWFEFEMSPVRLCVYSLGAQLMVLCWKLWNLGEVESC